MACKKGKDIFFLEFPDYLYSSIIIRSSSDDSSKARHCPVNELYSQISLNSISNESVIFIACLRVHNRLQTIYITQCHYDLFCKERCHAAIKGFTQIGFPQVFFRFRMKHFFGHSKGDLHIPQCFYFKSSYCVYHATRKGSLRKSKNKTFTLLSNGFLQHFFCSLD